MVRSEIIFLITPSIVQDETLWEVGRDTLGYSDAVRVGARAGLLPFSREKVTTNYNQLAMDAQNRGDTGMAQFYINNSLRLNPNQPEMIRLRQRVTGEPIGVHEPSIMERTMRRELGSLGWAAPATEGAVEAVLVVAEMTPEAAAKEGPSSWRTFWQSHWIWPLQSYWSANGGQDGSGDAFIATVPTNDEN